MNVRNLLERGFDSRTHVPPIETAISAAERWHGDRLHIVLDNSSPHKHLAVREWAAASDMDLVFLPTYRFCRFGPRQVGVVDVSQLMGSCR